MIVASIEGTIITAVVALFIVLIRWLGGERAPAKPADDTMRESANPRSGRGRSESEEERKRRFLEALGIPADSPEAQRPTSPPPLRTEKQRQSGPIKPVPPIIPELPVPRRSSGKRTPPLPKQVSKQRPFPNEVQPRSSDEAPAPTIPAGEIHVPELRTPEVEQFETVSSRISAIHEVGSDLGRRMTGIDETRQVGPEKEELWREALRSPQALRSAFILKEILGAPRGLQSDAFDPSLRTL